MEHLDGHSLYKWLLKAMRTLERGPSSTPALSWDNPLLSLTTYAGPWELWTITLQTAAKASGSTYASAAVFVFNRFSAHNIHILWSVILRPQALIRAAFLEGGNWWWAKDDICNVILLLIFVHRVFGHIQCQQCSLEAVSSKAICLCGLYLMYKRKQGEIHYTDAPLPPCPTTQSQ